MIGDSSPVRGDVVSYLESIYESMAETLPDFRDVKLDPNQRDLVVDVGSEEREADPYALELLAATEKGKMPRQRKRQVEINQARTTDHFEERYLPPGKMKEYFDQYCLLSELPKPASFAQFWRVSSLH